MSSSLRRFGSAALLLVALVGCSNGTSPERSGAATPTGSQPRSQGASTPAENEAFCRARDSASAAVQQLVADVNDGDFTAASGDLTSVKSAFDELVTSSKTLATSVKKDIQPALDSFEQTMKSLDDASSASDLVAALGSAATDLSDAMSTLSTNVDCS